jgi:hypothetical protein
MVVNEIEDPLTNSVEHNIKDAFIIKYILMMNFECEKEQCCE